MTLTAEANAAAGKTYNETLTEQLEAALSRYDHTSGKAEIPGEAALLQEVSELLAKNANPNGNWGSDVPPLAQAVTRNYMHVATLLLEKGADVNWKDKSGRNLLHFAAEHNSPAVVDALIRRKPGLLDEADTWTLNPMELAHARSRAEVAGAIVTAVETHRVPHNIAQYSKQTGDFYRKKARSAVESRYSGAFPELAAT